LVQRAQALLHLGFIHQVNHTTIGLEAPIEPRARVPIAAPFVGSPQPRHIIFGLHLIERIACS
jgi:hypothetical protein